MDKSQKHYVEWKKIYLLYDSAYKKRMKLKLIYDGGV